MTHCVSYDTLYQDWRSVSLQLMHSIKNIELLIVHFQGTYSKVSLSMDQDLSPKYWQSYPTLSCFINPSPSPLHPLRQIQTRFYQTNDLGSIKPCYNYTCRYWCLIFGTSRASRNCWTTTFSQNWKYFFELPSYLAYPVFSKFHSTNYARVDLQKDFFHP